MCIAAVILAAGKATRMGSVKQLLPYKGTTLLQHVIKQVEVSDVNYISCVLGANFQVLKHTLTNHSVTVIDNQKWELGLSSSISVAVTHLKTLQPLPEGVLFLLADQPHVDSDYINKIINCFKNNNGKIVASNYANGHGVPALFPAVYYDALLNLKGDKGAKLFLVNHKERVISIKTSSEDVLFDVDTPKDYNKLVKGKSE
ncbi:nucleotidyltransferase family protein [Algibacter pectinivorans]|uniref:Molybdenum cofactor cytidylyltransferase n=1 Tax=Algibacter pectinivorans TaxID=870482 RepID=A0A1I1Q4W5_9FLAO|nr:nucleotidyltransferase family protein [Algibacter pectinivorans]SFD17037.1 molybdenum cofactor cytidylyltransferase [Algibacter pectinivorans]